MAICLYYYFEWWRDWLQSTCACAQYSISTWLHTALNLVDIILLWMVHNLQTKLPTNASSSFTIRCCCRRRIKILMMQQHFDVRLFLFETFSFICNGSETEQFIWYNIYNTYNVKCIEESFDWNLSWLPILILM